MKQSLLILALALSAAACREKTAPAPADFFAENGDLTLELTAQRSTCRAGEPMLFQGLAVNHSKTKERAFVLLPGDDDLRHLIFALRNLNTQEVQLFSDAHLRQAEALLDAAPVNVQMHPGDTLRCFRIDLQRMNGFKKVYADSTGVQTEEQIRIKPGNTYELNWSVSGSFNGVSKPAFFRCIE